MRLISYNILDGGEGRADPIAEVIEAQRPDIVALVEADKPEIVERIAARLDMEHVTAVGKRHTAALLSKWPIIESINHGQLKKEMSNCFLEAVVHEASGTEWHLGVVHLHPRATISDDRERQREIQCICETFAESRQTNRPHLLCGDFNSDSPIQLIDPNACKPATQKAWHANGEMIPRQAIANLLNHGYVDLLHAVHGEKARTMASFTTNYPGQRVDYVFTFGTGRRIKSAWIEQDRLAKYASDHFPVGIEI
jgi:endonuclease/exonuclease/phosphatase family metal-dependent hydrolase